MRKKAWLLVLGFWFFTQFLSAATLTVLNTNDSGAGSLRSAISSATAGDTIDFAIGGSPSSATITLTSDALTIILSPLTIQNTSSTAITISGDSSHPIFFVSPVGDMILTDVTLSSGLAVGGNGGTGAGAGGGGGGGGGGLGGAIFIDAGGAATLSQVALNSNRAQGGIGAPGNSGSTPSGGGTGGASGGTGTTGSSSSAGGGGGGGGGWGEGNGGGGGGQSSSSSPGGFGSSGSGGSGGFLNTSPGAPTGGGGGGGGYNTAGGAGGPGGGGGGSYQGAGGAGGVGAGGGGSSTASAGAGGYGGGNASGVDGGGGGALGGAVFVLEGGSLTIGDGVTFSTNTVTGGASGGGSAGAGSALGPDLFINSGSTLTLSPTTSFTFSSIIAGDTVNSGGGVNLDASSSSVVVTLSADNSYGGSTTLTQGVLAISNDNNLGNTANTIIGHGGTLRTTADINSARGITLGASTNTSLDTDGNTLTLSGPISGSGSLTKIGLGELSLSHANNVYSGGTTITEGTLSVNAAGEMGAGVVTLNGGELSSTGGFTDANAFTLGSSNGTINVQANTYTLTGSIGGSGTLTTTGNGTLDLSGANLYTGGTTVSSGTLALSGTGSISDSASLAVDSIFDISGVTSSATVNNLSGSGTVSLGSKALTIAPSSPTTFSGVIADGGISGGTGGSLTVGGSSTLTLSGPNIYTGNTTVSSGILALSGTGSISDSSMLVIGSGTAFDISGLTSATTVNNLSGGGNVLLGSKALTIASSSSTTFSGTIGGAGSLIKTGAGTLGLSGTNSYGNTSVDAGTLFISGSTTSNMSVLSGATLGGSGTVIGNIIVDANGTLTNGSTFTITGNVVNFGTIGLGNSVGEIDINGNLTMESGSNLQTYFTNQGNSLLAVGQDATIITNAQLNLIAGPGFNLFDQEFTILTSNVLTGKFSTVTVNSSMLNPIVTYLNGDIFVKFYFLGVSNFMGSGNAFNVAVALDEIALTGNSAFSSLFLSLAFLDPAQLNSALNQLQPALFKGLAVSQENSAVKVQDTLSFRFQQELDQVHCFDAPQTCPDPFHVWLDGFGDILHQRSNTYASSPQVGYETKTGGVVAGVDRRIADCFYVGALGAYTGSTINWVHGQGSGDINTGYGGIYFSALGDLFYANASLIGGWSQYHAKRHISYPGVSESAKNSHGGSQLLSHLDTGLNFGIAGVSIRPFDSFDYIAQREDTFTEKGAGVYDLKVKDSNAILLRNELGVQFATCFCVCNSNWMLSPKISWVREVRIKGSHYTAEFAHTNIPFRMTGYFANHNRVSPGVMLSGTMWEDQLTVDLYYNGEFSGPYSDNNYGGQIRYAF